LGPVSVPPRRDCKSGSCRWHR